LAPYFVHLNGINYESFYTAIFILLFHYGSQATTWTVTVADFSFNPATVNAVVGDVIKFDWVSGFHTTTCGSGLAEHPCHLVLRHGMREYHFPALRFSYTVTVVGNYLYGCVPHFASGMQGTIIASSALPVSFGSFAVTGNNNKAFLQWKTFSESNTDYFSIRKSRDGTNFYEIGEGRCCRKLQYYQSIPIY
jgi:plastocyanin